MTPNNKLIGCTPPSPVVSKMTGQSKIGDISRSSSMTGDLWSSSAACRLDSRESDKERSSRIWKERGVRVRGSNKELAKQLWRERREREAKVKCNEEDEARKAQFIAISKCVSPPVIPTNFIADKKVCRRGPEYEIQMRFVKTLGIFREFVKTPAGVADVVDDNTIYEVKRSLGSQDLHHAVGQLISYSHFIKGKKLCIVTEQNRLGQVAIDICESVGITIIEFKG